jgi:peroxiredoxin
VASFHIVSAHSTTAGVGRPAPDFTLTDQHGQVFHLADALSSGPVVVVFLRGFG